MIKRFIWTTLLAVAFLSEVNAKTITCPTCSQSDFEYAVYNSNAAAGDTIVLPAGSATWGNSQRANSGVIYLTTSNITVQGQGDSTVITLDDSGATYANGVIAVWGAVTFQNIKIIGSSVNPVTAFQVAANGTFAGGFRLTNITYVGGTAQGYFAYIGSGVNYGLIDNCRITGNSGSTELIFGRGPTNAWQQPNTLGGANNIFIEDCTFNNLGYVCDANSNAHFVVRYNTINGQNKVDGHGLASNTPARSFRNMEVYGNHWTDTAASSTAIELRGGTSMVFDNVSDNPNGSASDWFLLTEYAYQAIWPNFGTWISNVSVGNPTTITTFGPHGLGTGWNVLIIGNKTTPAISLATTNIVVTSPTTFTAPINVTAGGDQSNTGSIVERYMTAFDYPIADQVGVGMDPKSAASEPAYVWNNLKQGVPWPRNFWNPAAGAISLYQAQTGKPSATFGESDVIKSNRDFYADAGFDTNTGVSRGTTSQMNALKPPVAGYGFWVTDQGNWKSGAVGTSGQLYVWNGSGWVLKYTPYTYPHPARRPTAPSGLKVVSP